MSQLIQFVLLFSSWSMSFMQAKLFLVFQDSPWRDSDQEI